MNKMASVLFAVSALIMLVTAVSSFWNGRESVSVAQHIHGVLLILILWVVTRLLVLLEEMKKDGGKAKDRVSDLSRD